jgi:hypothetical protein
MHTYVEVKLQACLILPTATVLPLPILSVHLVIRKLYLIFSLTIVGKLDNTWPLSTNWTVRGPSVQIRQCVAYQYKLDKAWLISTHWTMLAHQHKLDNSDLSVQTGQYVAHQYKLDNTWPDSTNWTIRDLSVQIGHYVTYQFKLENALPISSNWTTRGL